RPDQIAPYAGLNVWWRCKKGHEWQSRIDKRTIRSQGCPVCVNRQVHPDNCLGRINPKLALEWHPTKNDVLTPFNVTFGSHLKVWWQCKNGHAWAAAIISRHKGSG